MHETVAEPAGVVVRSAKIPADLAERLDALAEHRRLTMSALLRSLIESAVAEDAGEPARGPVERQVLTEIEEMGYRGAPGRVAVALELARQLDGTRTNSPAVAGQIRMLLAEMRDHVGAASASKFNWLVMLRLQVQLTRLGFEIVNAEGRGFDVAKDWPDDGSLEWIVS